MKRLVAVCLVAGLLLATSTAAFATPVIGGWVWSAPDYSNTVSSGFTKTFAADWSSTITWFQPYSNAAAPTLPTMADLGFDPAGTITWTGPTIAITSATLTIGDSGVNADTPVWRGTSSSSWAAQVGNLSATGGSNHTGTGTSTITLASPNAWLAPTGFWVQVRAPGSDQDVAVQSSKLTVSATWSYDFSYEPPLPPPPAPVVPAPGAILLASMGAGLVSWLRNRKAL